MNSTSTLLFSINFSTDTKLIEWDKDNTKDEILIKGPAVNSILEFADRRMIVAIKPCDLLIIEDF